MTENIGSSKYNLFSVSFGMRPLLVIFNWKFLSRKTKSVFYVLYVLTKFNIIK